MDDPPESPEHSHTPANAALAPESSCFRGVNSVLASSSRPNPFTESNSCRRRLSLTGSRFGDPSLDHLRDHSDPSILHHNSQFGLHPIFESTHSNYETGEMATRLPPLSLQQTQEENQIKERVDLQLRDRVLQERSYIAPSTFLPQVDQNQHGINTFGLQFNDIQHNARTSESSFHNRPENTFQWCTPYNLQVQEPVSLHNSVAPRGAIFDQRPPKPDNAAGFDNLFSSSPKRKRMSLNTTAGYNSDIHCKCTKTSCLKLYCECFSAETYCDDLCTCHGCMNREDYEDTVEDIKEKIEIRKPNAFRPKIQHGDGTGLTTSLARHKRGCNCKKSKCLKKYCECYQANVGCCDVCRCENCENSHGKKDEYLAKKHEMVAPQEALVHNDLSSIPHSLAPTSTSFLEYLAKKHEMVAPQEALMHNGLSSIPHNLAPTVSPFQFSNYAEATPDSWHGPGQSMEATPYGINLQQPMPMLSSATFPANNLYGVNDELMMSGTGFHMQYDHPGVNPMNQFSQNVIGFGNSNLVSAMPDPENWLNNNTTNAGIFSHNGGQISTGNAQTFPHNDCQIPSANAQMLLGNGRIPTTVNPNAAHQMNEESPTPHPNAAVQISFSSGDGDMSGYYYLLHGPPSSSKGFDGHTHTAAKKD